MTDVVHSATINKIPDDMKQMLGKRLEITNAYYLLKMVLADKQFP